MLNAESKKKLIEQTKATRRRRKSSDRTSSEAVEQKNQNDDRLHEERYKALIENIPCAVYSAFPGKTGPTIFMSKKWREWTGYSPEELYQDPEAWPRCIHPDDREETLNAYAVSCTEGVAYCLEYRLVHKDTGQVRYVTDQGILNRNEEGVVVGVDGIVTDITEQKKTENELKKYRDHLENVVGERTAELSRANENLKLEDIDRRKVAEALCESEEKFRTMFELLPYSTVLSDLEGNILACNQQFTRLHATAEGPDAQVGRNVSEFFPEEERSALLASIGKTIAERDTQSLTEYTMLRENGTKFLAEARSTVVLDEHGEPRGLLAIAHDVTDRKQAEEALARSERMFRTYFELGLVGMAVTSPQKGWIYANDNVCRMLGYPRDELMKTTWADLTHPDDLQADVTQFERVLSGEIDTYSMDKRFIREDGSIVYVSLSVACVRRDDGSVEHFIAHLHDITDRKEAAKALLESERRYETVVENAGEGIVVVQEGRLQFVNPYVETVFGRTQEEMGSRPFIEFVHPDDRDWVMDIHVRRFKGEDVPPAYELRVIDKHGVTRWVENNGILIEWNGRPATLNFLRDITDRKEAEDALRRSEGQYRRLVDTSPHGIQEVDGDGKIIFANRACHCIYGYGDGELIGKYVWDLTSGEGEREQLRELIGRLIEERPEPSAYSGRSLTKDGRVIDVQLDWDYVLDADGRVDGFTSIITDITERKRAQEALRQSEKELDTIFNISPVAVILLDADIVIRKANLAATILANRESKDILGLSLGEAFSCVCYLDDPRGCGFGPECERCVACATIQDTLDTDNPHHQVEVVSTIERDGVRIEQFFLVSTTPLHTSGHSHVLATVENISARRKAERSILENREQLKSLASQLSRMEERERHRLATALHDHVGQSLVFSKLKLDELRISGPSGDLADALKEVCSSIEQAIQETRTLTFDLSSPILYELGFEAAVAEWLADEIEGKHGIETEFCDDGQEKPLDVDIRALLFRNVRELLINVVKHAQAHKVKVEVRRTGADVCVSVEDDGIGFDPAEVKAVAAKSDKFGLFSIRERLEQLGGLIEIDSGPDQGSRILMKAPLKCETLTDGMEL